jgi:hypothetical protein
MGTRIPDLQQARYRLARESALSVRDATAGVLDECTLADARGKQPAAYRVIDLGKGASKIGAARRASNYAE